MNKPSFFSFKGFLPIKNEEEFQKQEPSGNAVGLFEALSQKPAPQELSFIQIVQTKRSIIIVRISLKQGTSLTNIVSM